MATRRKKSEEGGVLESPLMDIIDQTGESPLMKDSIENVQYIPVEGNRDLVRDPRTGAILNTNKKAYFRAVQERQRRNSEDNEYESLKSEVAELKEMLAQLLEKVNANGNN